MHVTFQQCGPEGTAEKTWAGHRPKLAFKSIVQHSARVAEIWQFYFLNEEQLNGWPEVIKCDGEKDTLSLMFKESRSSTKGVMEARKIQVPTLLVLEQDKELEVTRKVEGTTKHPHQM